jgi:hypothetical protein
MKCVRLLLASIALLGVIGCARLPKAEVEAARAAVAALENNTDVSTHAADALGAAREALDRMNAEVEAQQKKSSLSRRYDTLKELSAQVVLLAQQATSAARDAREREEQLLAESRRINDAMDAIDRASPESAGRPEVGIVTGGSLEYLAYSAMDGMIALFDGGYPDTSMGEGYVPQQRAVLYQSMIAMSQEEVIPGTRDEVLAELAGRAPYVSEPGALGYPADVARFASRTRIGAEPEYGVFEDVYMIDDRSGAGIRLCSLEQPPAVADVGEAISVELPFWVTSDGKAAVALTRRPGTNEFDTGADIAIIVAWDGLNRFAGAVAELHYKDAGTRAVNGDPDGALAALSELTGTGSPTAERLLALSRTDKYLENVRAMDTYGEFIRSAFPRTSRYGLEELFQDYGCEVVQTELAGELDAESLESHADFRTAIIEGSREPVNFAGQCVVVVWGCGGGCQSGVLIDLSSGVIHDLPEAATVGFEHQATSRLLVVNPPSDFEGFPWLRQYDYPAYYQWTGAGFELLSDTRIPVVRGK